MAQGFRYSLDEPVTAECDLHPAGHLFDPSTFYRCTNPSPPITRAYGAPVYPSLSNIFAHIAPPRRVNAGGTALTGEQLWEEGGCAGCSSFTDVSALPINPSGLVDAAPQAIYKSAAYIEGQPAGVMTFKLSELVKYEKYKVRLHFASIFPASAMGSCLENVMVNGSSRVIDPYTGPAKGTIMTFDDVSPDENSVISVAIPPQNPNGSAMICGIEVLMNPLIPVAADIIRWDLAATFPWLAVGTNGIVVTSHDLKKFSTSATPSSALLYSVTFGTKGFVAVGAAGTVVQSDEGQNWRSQQLQPLDLYGIAYGDGLYVAVGTNGYVQVSADASSWTVSRPTSVTLRDVCFGDGMFMTVAVGKPSFAHLSLDGISWSPVELPVNALSASYSPDSFWFTGSGATNFVGKLRLRAPMINLTGTVDSAGVVSLAFDAPVAGTYSILCSADPASTNWQTEATLQRGNSDQISWNTTNNVARARFFRVRLN